jgi:hypothetical protein
MKKIQVILIPVLLAALSGYSAPLTVNFENDTAGASPKADKVSPSSATAENGVTVIDAAANKAGTGQGISFIDNSATAGTGLEFNFVDDAASQVSAFMAGLNFSCINKSDDGKGYIAVGTGAFDSKLNTAANRLSEVRLYAKNTMKVAADGSTTGQKDRAFNSIGEANKLVMVVNDTPEPITYDLGGAQTLKGDSVDYWLNGKLAATVALDKEVVGTDKNFGRIGFASNSGTVGVDFVFDDIVVTPIP